MVIKIEENKLVEIYSNDLVRYLTARSYFYLYRRKIEGIFVTFYKDSPLLREIIDIYDALSKEERTTYIPKYKQKAE